jgi:hypothetical protein
MKKTKPNHALCEDCEDKPATRSYEEDNGEYAILCQRCYDVRTLRDASKYEEEIL